MRLFNATKRKVILTTDVRIEVPPYPRFVDINQAQYNELQKSKSFQSMIDRKHLVRNMMPVAPITDLRTEKEMPEKYKPPKDRNSKVQVDIKAGRMDIPQTPGAQGSQAQGATQ